MKSIKFFFFSLLFLSVAAFASDLADYPADKFFGDIFETVKAFGGMPWTLKIAAIVTLVISSMKVSFVRPLWDKLGWAKGIVWAVLSVLVGIVTLSSGGNLTFAGVAAYLFAGAGAVILHELLDSLKGIPGVGGVYLSIIEFAQKLLKAPPQVESK